MLTMPFDFYDFWIPFWGFFQAFYGIGIAISVVSIAARWIVFQKAGEEGWAAIIPFYNNYILYKFTWGNGWYFLLLFIPLANAVIHIITMVKLAKVFGKGGGWACGLIFLYPVFLCIMAFDKSVVYVGDYPGDKFNDGSTQQNNFGFGQQSSHGAPKFCSSCGSPVNEGDKFCLHCGHPLY